MTVADGRHSKEVVKFMTLYAELRQRTNDDPSGLGEWAERDDGFREQCVDLDFAAGTLRVAEMSHPELFAVSVDPNFIKTWRDFEARFETAVGDVWVRQILPELAGKSDAWHGWAEADRRWEIADRTAEEEVNSVEEVFSFARDQANAAFGHPEDYVEEIVQGIREWTSLRSSVGLDLRGVLRRRRLVPFVNLPSPVAARYGANDPVSLIANLRDAHDAFVFGAPLAALAMMRSILEGVLRDHYSAGGERDGLERRIEKARGLPEVANQQRLFRLSDRANMVLHLNKFRDKKRPPPPPLDAVGLEKEIASLLLVLRALIEGAPVQPTAT